MISATQHLLSRVRNENYLHEAFITAARCQDIDSLKRLLELGADVNYQDEEGSTALHHVAALGKRSSLRFLIGLNTCNFLLADIHGRYPSDLATEWSRDYAVARLLTRKRMHQAFAEGVPCRGPNP